MKKTRAIIVDDEKWARTVLQTLLERDFNNIDVIAQCIDVLSAVEKINELKPDIVFLDIEMPNYAGYEIVNFFDEINFEIIFVTAFDQYAIKAFEVNALDYLVKPIDRVKLQETIKKLNSKIDSNHKIEQYQLLLKTIKKGSFNKIILPELGNRRIIDLNDIIAIKADDTYTIVYLSSNKTITVSKTLKYFENLLEDNNTFFRSHRSWIINLTYIEKVNKTENIIFLKNGLKTTISRTKFNQFEQAIK